MTAAPRVLVADDDPALLELMRLTLLKEGYEVEAAQTAKAVCDLLEGGPYEVIVSDVYLGDGTAIDLLERIHDASPDAAVILVTAQGTVETAVAAKLGGVFDYLAKPFELKHLVGRVEAALRPRRHRAGAARSGPESMIIGSHPRIVEVYKAVARVGPLPVPVLIRGETGTGKELVARALHRYGANPSGPFIAVNCAAIAPGLLESELFGHRRGAFTGADRDHRGALVASAEGTVFLDEVAELPPSLQVKLLRFLQEGEVWPVGADGPVTVRTRVVAATHRDLRAAVRAGEAREDFYYRLAAYEIEIPPLRERASDIPLLVDHFRRRIQAELALGELSGPSDATLNLLARHRWPGNVRELEHLVQRAAIDLGTLAEDQGVAGLLQTLSADHPPDPAPAIGSDLSLEELERLHIEAVLRRCGGNRTRAAEILGIERKSLYRKAKRLDIPLDPED
jgi:two-component system nitrogen regulation response regulator GlnG